MKNSPGIVNVEPGPITIVVWSLTSLLTASGNLSEIQTLGLHPRPAVLETMVVGLRSPFYQTLQVILMQTQVLEPLVYLELFNLLDLFIDHYLKSLN